MTTTINGKALAFNETYLFCHSDIIDINAGPFPIRLVATDDVADIGVNSKLNNGVFHFCVEGVGMHDDHMSRGGAMHEGKMYRWYARAKRVGDFPDTKFYRIHLTIFES
jgi:hypothetical protein